MMAWARSVSSGLKGPCRVDEVPGVWSPGGWERPPQHAGGPGPRPGELDLGDQPPNGPVDRAPVVVHHRELASVGGPPGRTSVTGETLLARSTPPAGRREGGERCSGSSPTTGDSSGIPEATERTLSPWTRSSTSVMPYQLMMAATLGSLRRCSGNPVRPPSIGFQIMRLAHRARCPGRLPNGRRLTMPVADPGCNGPFTGVRSLSSTRPQLRHGRSGYRPLPIHVVASIPRRKACRRSKRLPLLTGGSASVLPFRGRDVHSRSGPAWSLHRGHGGPLTPEEGARLR